MLDLGFQRCLSLINLATALLQQLPGALQQVDSAAVARCTLHEQLNEGFHLGRRHSSVAKGGQQQHEITLLRPVLPPHRGTTAHCWQDANTFVPAESITAHLALTAVSRFSPGESLLIHAGVGGLGSQFAQVARALGAGRVDAVVGTPAKQDIAHELGYDRAYLRSDVASMDADTYDIVIDPVGGAATKAGFGVLRAGGRLVRVGNASQSPDVALSSMAHWIENKTTAGFNVGAWLAERPEEGAASLRWALEAAARGEIRVDLTRVGEVNEVPDLLAALERGDTTGKLAVRMAVGRHSEILL